MSLILRKECKKDSSILMLLEAADFAARFHFERIVFQGAFLTEKSHNMNLSIGQTKETCLSKSSQLQQQLTFYYIKKKVQNSSLRHSSCQSSSISSCQRRLRIPPVLLQCLFWLGIEADPVYSLSVPPGACTS